MRMPAVFKNAGLLFVLLWLAFFSIEAQAAIDKRNAQRVLLDSAQAIADVQHKSAVATRDMADAKRQLAELETARLAADTETLVATRQAIAQENAESAANAVERASSATMTHQVIGRLTQPSAAPAKV